MTILLAFSKQRAGVSSQSSFLTLTKSPRFSECSSHTLGAGIPEADGRPMSALCELALTGSTYHHRRGMTVFETQTLRALGGTCGRERGRRQRIEEMIDGATGEAAEIIGTRAACAATGVAQASYYRCHRQSPRPQPRPRALHRRQPGALSPEERVEIKAVLDSEGVQDESPAAVYATLLDEGRYLSSISTMYRVLREAGEVRERRRQASHPATVKPELVAQRPDQVWSSDISKLLGGRLAAGPHLGPHSLLKPADRQQELG